MRTLKSITLALGKPASTRSIRGASGKGGDTYSPSSSSCYDMLCRVVLCCVVLCCVVLCCVVLCCVVLCCVVSFLSYAILCHVMFTLSSVLFCYVTLRYTLCYLMHLFLCLFGSEKLLY
jgi:hypothetical protein